VKAATNFAANTSLGNLERRYPIERQRHDAAQTICVEAQSGFAL
jgi:hypothetical protein